MGLGLLGAIGGLGSGLAQVGQFMYNEELDKAKTARLQQLLPTKSMQELEQMQ